MCIFICVMKAINCLELHLISLSLRLTFWRGERLRLEHKIKGLLSQPRTFRELRDLVKHTFFFVEMLFGYSNQHLYQVPTELRTDRPHNCPPQTCITMKIDFLLIPIWYFFSWVGNFTAFGTRRMKAFNFHVSLTGV